MTSKNRKLRRAAAAGGVTPIVAQAPPPSPVLRPARKIYIALISYTAKPHYSVMGTINQFYTEASQHGWQVHLAIRTTDSIITRARNVNLAEFAKSDCTDLLFLDDDISAGPGALTRLMNHDVDLVAGVYRMRADPENYVVRPFADVLQYSSNGLMQVEAAPTGFMRITRRCAEMMIEAHKDEWYEDQTAPGLRIYNLFDFELREHAYWSEDYVFCKRWGELGGKTWIDPDIPLGHSGDKTFSGCFGEFLRRKHAEMVSVHTMNVPQVPQLAAEAKILLGDAA